MAELWAVGLVEEIELHEEHVYFRIPSKHDGNFRVYVTNQNYASFYSTILSAFLNRFSIQVRTQEGIEPGKTAEVVWIGLSTRNIP